MILHLFFTFVVSSLGVFKCNQQTTCSGCVVKKAGLPCRWCPVDQKCHTPGAIFTNPCKMAQNIVLLANCPEAPMLPTMKPCPPTWGILWNVVLPAGWQSYYGDVFAFHCGFRGIVEIDNPNHKLKNECFYDDSGLLVGPEHPWSGCQGTPDEFLAGDGHFFTHFLFDSGGPCDVTQYSWSLSEVCKLGIQSMETSYLHAKSKNLDFPLSYKLILKIVGNIKVDL